ncbi:uncharacterized protein LOC129634548 isoform X8 [Bubalus kerabau]|uniref:uncharacterized protein LOC129634548 isoform X8 n=1 Tax=Bubalus carabanensis TaxID=3119969 RepID=UPI00244EBA4F|nr:uncharacterized protein LOC129634548 isoform X8 [Bubalus carabanensis]
MTFPEDSCKHWTLGCTLRSSWISPGPDHYVAREIGHRNRAKSQWAAGEAAPVTSFQSTLSSEGNRAAPCLSAQLSCFLSTTAGQERQSLPEPSRPSLLSRDQTWPSSPSPAPGVCFVNTSVEQERTKPARTKKSVSEMDNFKGPYAQHSAHYCMTKIQTTIDTPHRYVIPEFRGVH